MRAKLVFFGFLALSAAAAVLLWARQPPVPAEIRARLDAEYPGWEFARLNDFNREQLGREQHPAWVEGDFDGDGRPDWAVQITHPGERFRQQSVLVFLARPGRYALYPLEVGGENEGIYLGRSPPGTGRDVVEDTLVTSTGDVLDLLFGQEASIAYVFRNGRFTSYTTGD